MMAMKGRRGPETFPFGGQEGALRPSLLRPLLGYDRGPSAGPDRDSLGDWPGLGSVSSPRGLARTRADMSRAP